MKKLLLVILIFSLLIINVCAQGDSWLKLQFTSVPEANNAGWVNLKTITDLNGDTVTVTVFNGGEDAFSCYISGRDDTWATVSATEQITVDSGESETLMLESIDPSANKFLIEFRDLYVGAVIFLKGEDTDYSRITSLTSDLSDHFILSQESLPEVTTPEATSTPEATATPEAALTPKATEKPVTTQTPLNTVKPSETSEAAEIYEPKNIYVTVTTLVITSVITAFTGVIIGGMLVFFVMKKNRKG